MFKPVPSKVSFPEMEERILRFWREHDLLHQVDRIRKDAPPFTLYEGPPTANGTPGIHHVLARVFKDVIPRYKTMRGFRPVRQGGWDTHGLPVELEIEKELGISTKREIEEFGIERFNALCKESVMRYVKEWEELTDRIGFWIDMPNAYVTFRNDYIETGWWIIKQLWDQGLVYQGYRVAPHCPRCVTTLSSHEVALGYQEDTPDPSAFVKFRLVGYDATVRARRALGGAFDTLVAHGQPVYFLVWTTTPWTLTANVALAIDASAEYSLVEVDEVNGKERFVLASALVHSVIREPLRILGKFPGRDLVALQYDPLYPTVGAVGQQRAYQVVDAPFVSMEDGTGIVHIAPAYGAEDQELGRVHSLPTVHTVDLNGVIEHPGLPGSGKFVKDADEDIMADLKQRSLLYRREVYRHTYPFCWRCESPLLYYAKSSWYIRTTARQQELVSNNQKINWYPDYIKEGRFGEWLRNNVDWALSRERYWGTPIPVWQCEGCGAYDCFGSVAELRTRALPEHSAALEPDRLDLHRPYVDHVTVGCHHCGGTMRRIPEVMDCWFDSGAMPFAQAHVMSIGELEELRRRGLFPADYICEAVDQTRGWFYSLHALSTLVAGEPCYRNVICLGLILDARGEKMSKSKGNVVEPWTVINSHGADALRWYLLTAAPPGNSRRFSADLVGESVRRFFLTLWNIYSFFVTYANIDGFNPRTAPTVQPASDLDRWILSEQHQLTAEVTRLLEGYNPTDAGRRIEEFVDVLSNWYVRRSRRRFWKPVTSANSVQGLRGLEGSENDQDKVSAYHTLYTCLTTLARLLAPLTPFVAEELYQNLARSVDGDVPQSVHLADWPQADESLIDRDLSEAMRLAMRVSSLGRAARQKAGIRVRQPLSKVVVKPRTPEERKHFARISPYILDELNVKDYSFVDDSSALYQVALERIGDQAQGVDELPVVEVSWEAWQAGQTTSRRYAAALEGGYMVALDAVITPDLADEGLARELVHRIQNMRRSAGFDIADRIVTWYAGDERVARVMERHGDYIRQETLSLELRQGEPEPGAHVEEPRMGGLSIKLGVRRAG